MTLVPQGGFKFSPNPQSLDKTDAYISPALMGIGPGVLNIDGGGMAIGHPLGATGARITGKAAALLERTGGRYALAAQCIGGGQGVATILEKI